MNVHKKTIGLYYQYKGRVYAKEEEGVSTIKGRKRRDTQVLRKGYIRLSKLS